jgi:hypothetical protein
VEEILSAPKTINDFNEETFNNLVEKIIAGEVDEDGNVNPNTINFILKVGSSYQYEIDDDKTVSFRTTNMAILVILLLKFQVRKRKMNGSVQIGP